jgi:hypothetical protein
MRNAIFRCTIFICAFLVGTFFALSWIKLVNQSERFNPNLIGPVEVEKLESPTTKIDEPPLFNPNIDYSSRLKVKLMQTGAFHAEEVPYRTGEKWLGLFRVGHSYVLKPTTIKIRALNDDGLMDKEVFTSNPESSVFLLRGATNLVPGEVDTVFDADRGDEFNLLGKLSFGLRGQFWKLWIENAAPEGYPQKGSALMLQRSGFDPQTLRTIPDGCNDCGWQVLWVGDIDRDSNLDFLIDVSGHYNSFEPTLFLSSAGDVGFVGVFAGFHGIGC